MVPLLVNIKNLEVHTFITVLISQYLWALQLKLLPMVRTFSVFACTLNAVAATRIAPRSLREFFMPTL